MEAEVSGFEPALGRLFFFDAGDLAANRRGEFSPGQRQMIVNASRAAGRAATRGRRLLFAAVGLAAVLTVIATAVPRAGRMRKPLVWPAPFLSRLWQASCCSSAAWEARTLRPPCSPPPGLFCGPAVATATGGGRSERRGSASTGSMSMFSGTAHTACITCRTTAVPGCCHSNASDDRSPAAWARARVAGESLAPVPRIVLSAGASMAPWTDGRCGRRCPATCG